MKVILKVFFRLDDDLSYEVLFKGGDEEIYVFRFYLVLFGVCVLVVFIKGIELIIVNCGDCRVVLGI